MAYNPLNALGALPVPPQTLSSRVNSHDVRLLRRVLSARGYGNPHWRDPALCPEVSGDYDDHLMLIVRNYQRENHLEVDGVCGPLTWARLAGYETWPATPKPAPATREAKLRKAIVARAASLVGIREATGRNDGPEVERIQHRAGGARGEPWCAAFCDVCVEDGYTDCGEAVPFDIGRSCSSLVSRLEPLGRVFIDPKLAQPGDLMVFKGGGGREIKFRGLLLAFRHVGIIVELRNAEGRFATIEGNTNVAGSSEGDGSYRKLRLAAGCVYVRTV
jgi:hypothetical protein